VFERVGWLRAAWEFLPFGALTHTAELKCTCGVVELLMGESERIILDRRTRHK
jgi:hypothetical protein